MIEEHVWPWREIWIDVTANPFVGAYYEATVFPDGTSSTVKFDGKSKEWVPILRELRL